MKVLSKVNFRTKNKSTLVIECQVCGHLNSQMAIPHGYCEECGENHNTYLSKGEYKAMLEMDAANE